MSDLTNYFADELTNHAFGKAAMSQYTSLYVGLSGTPILADGTGATEPGDTYVRQLTDVQNDWTLSGEYISNDLIIAWPIATGAWGTISWAFLADALSGGNILVAKAFTPTRSPVAGDYVDFKVGNLKFILDRIL